MGEEVKEKNVRLFMEKTELLIKGAPANPNYCTLVEFSAAPKKCVDGKVKVGAKTKEEDEEAA